MEQTGINSIVEKFYDGLFTNEEILNFVDKPHIDNFREFGKRLIQERGLEAETAMGEVCKLMSIFRKENVKIEGLD